MDSLCDTHNHIACGGSLRISAETWTASYFCRFFVAFLVKISDVFLLLQLHWLDRRTGRWVNERDCTRGLLELVDLLRLSPMGSGAQRCRAWAGFDWKNRNPVWTCSICRWLMSTFKDTGNHIVGVVGTLVEVCLESRLSSFRSGVCIYWQLVSQ